MVAPVIPAHVGTPPTPSVVAHSKSQMLATVDALLPLSLLEAVRDVDKPEGVLEAEFVDELRNKRLGLSDTVYSQIKRYTEAVRRNQRTAQEEAVALAKLIGRRPDAEAVLRAAGRFLAREAYMTVSPVTRGMVRVFPALVSRPMALRQVRRIARRYLNGNVRRVGTSVLLEIPRSITVGVAAGDVGCAYYEATLRELLRLLVGTTGSVEHTRCEGRGEGSCEWRADWRGADHAQQAQAA
jgi:predicted hydrocarbon binding protein